MNNKMAKNYIYNLCFQILSVIAPLITTPYISRILGPENIGIYSFTTSIVSYFSLFLLLGLHLYGQREVAYNQDNVYVRTLRLIEIQSLKFIMMLFSLSAFTIFIKLYSEYETILLINLIVLISNFFDISWFFQGLEEFKLAVIWNSIVKIVGIVAIFVFVKNDSQLWLYVFINVCITLIGNMSLWPYLKKYICKVKCEDILIFRNIKIIIELFIPLLAVQVYYMLDKTMLGILNASSMTESGNYEQTTKIVNLCMMLITSLSTVLLPRMSAEFSDNNHVKMKGLIEKSLHYMAFISCPICFGLIAISDSIVPWFLGKEFERVGELLHFYPLILLIIPISSILGNGVLTPTGKHNKGTIAVVCGATVNAILNFVFIVCYGAMGAVVSTIIAEFFVAVIHIHYSKDYIICTPLLKKYLKYGMCSIIMCVVVRFCSTLIFIEYLPFVFQTIILTIIGIIIYILEVIFIIKDNTIRDLLKLLKQRDE